MAELERLRGCLEGFDGWRLGYVDDGHVATLYGPRTGLEFPLPNGPIDPNDSELQKFDPADVIDLLDDEQDASRIFNSLQAVEVPGGNTEHRVGIVSVRTLPESRSRSVFRQFTPEMFYCAYESQFSSAEALTAALDDPEKIPFDVIDLYKSNPEVAVIAHVLWTLDVNAVVKAYPEIHRKLIARPDITVEEMTDESENHNIRMPLGQALSLFGPYNRLKLSIMASFTPPELRPKIKSFIRPREARRIINNVPDFSGLTTTEEKLDAVIRLMSFTYDQALAEVCASHAVDPEGLASLRQTDSATFAAIHREAGLLYARSNLYGILEDMEHGGADSAFKFLPGDEKERFKEEGARTDLHQCPGSSYARNFYLGVGRLLADNRDMVLDLMKTYRLKPSDLW